MTDRTPDKPALADAPGATRAALEQAILKALGASQTRQAESAQRKARKAETKRPTRNAAAKARREAERAGINPDTPGIVEPRGGAKPGAGRPSIYSDAIASAYLEAIACGATALQVSTIEGMPSYSTVLKWAKDRDDFAAALAQARAQSAEALLDQAVEITDSVSNAGRDDHAKVQAARVRADIRLKVAAKRDPSKFSERVQTTVSGTVRHEHAAITDDRRAAALAVLLNRLAIDGAQSPADALLAMLSGPTSDSETGQSPKMIDATPLVSVTKASEADETRPNEQAKVE